MVLELIKIDTSNEIYWIMMYLVRGKIEKDSVQEQRAIKFMFKAYDINPSNHLVLSCLIRHYNSLGQFKQMFKILLITQKLNHGSPFCISVLTLLNARSFIHGGASDE